MTNHNDFNLIASSLVELKDTSELMMDLAYSSLLLNSRELAEEVLRLEEYVDNLHTSFEMLALKSNFSKEEASGFLGLIRLGVAAEKIADAAADMAEVVLRGIEPHPVLKLAIKAAEETVAQACVTTNSPLLNSTVKDACIQERTGMTLLAIKRGEKCIRPKPELVIKEGDVLIVSGYVQGVSGLKQLASPDDNCIGE
jgi:uncharacterized protein with PhoU and TrkA domain